MFHRRDTPLFTSPGGEASRSAVYKHNFASFLSPRFTPDKSANAPPLAVYTFFYTFATERFSKIG